MICNPIAIVSISGGVHIQNIGVKLRLLTCKQNIQVKINKVVDLQIEYIQVKINKVVDLQIEYIQVKINKVVDLQIEYTGED